MDVAVFVCRRVRYVSLYPKCHNCINRIYNACDVQVIITDLLCQHEPVEAGDCVETVSLHAPDSVMA